MLSRPLKPIRILLAEDLESDVYLTKRAFRMYPNVTFDVAKDGEEALMKAFKAKHDLIMLDLNLPRLRGDEVLQRLKRSPTTRHIPTVVLSSSDDEEEIRRMYGLHAASYITKPADPSMFRKLAERFGGYWVHLASLPKSRSS